MSIYLPYWEGHFTTATWWTKWKPSQMGIRCENKLVQISFNLSEGHLENSYCHSRPQHFPAKTPTIISSGAACLVPYPLLSRLPHHYLLLKGSL